MLFNIIGHEDCKGLLLQYKRNIESNLFLLIDKNQDLSFDDFCFSDYLDEFNF